MLKVHQSPKRQQINPWKESCLGAVRHHVSLALEASQLQVFVHMEMCSGKKTTSSKPWTALLKELRLHWSLWDENQKGDKRPKSFTGKLKKRKEKDFFKKIMSS